MPPFLEHVIVALIVLGALVYLARAWRGKKKKSDGCDSCGGTSTRRK